MMKTQPKISIIIPTYNTNIKHLQECIESVINQSYENWELCIADDCSADQKVRDTIIDYAAKDNRIKYVFREQNGHICKASNSALELATGQYVGLLDHDDILWPNALFEVTKALNELPKAEMIYCDEDKLEEDGLTHVDPFFKPDWSPHYLLSINYIAHFSVIKHRIINKIGGFREGTEGAQDWDLFLRASREIVNQDPILSQKPFLQKEKIVHIPTVLYSWRKSPNSTASEQKGDKVVKSYAYVNQKKTLQNYLGNKALVYKTKHLGLWFVKCKLQEKPLVTIIIPTKEKIEYIEKCLKSIKDNTTYKNIEIILVDTGSKDKATWELYSKYKLLFIDKLRVMKWEKSFNFSAVCNYGSSQAKGKYLIFLNNDTEIITEDWIEEMLGYAQQKNVGVVGAKLLFPNGLIQHAGVVTGLGIASHYMRGQQDNAYQSFPMVLAKDVVRNVSGVTGACMMMSKTVFDKVGGFNEELRIAYNDVDLCLEVLHRLGLLIVYSPFAKLIHHESISIGYPHKGTRDNSEFIKENKYMHNKWKDIIENDPYYNKNLTRQKEDFSLDI